MNSIPVLGALVLTGPEWIERQLESIDYPVDNYVLFDNGGKPETKERLEALFEKSHPFIKNKVLCHLPSNLGVAAGWNLIIKSYMMAPYWIIVNHDVSFSEGLLKEMGDAATQNPETGIISANAGDFGWGSYDLFLIKDWVVQKVGLFDESFYPAYCEDTDYMIRAKNNGIKTMAGLNCPIGFSRYLHGETCDYAISGSQTAKSSASLNEGFTKSKELNLQRLQKKWGECYLTSPSDFELWLKNKTSKKPYTSPYDIVHIDDNDDEETTRKRKAFASNYHLLGSTSFDLEFVRSKHLGDF